MTATGTVPPSPKTGSSIRSSWACPASGPHRRRRRRQPAVLADRLALRADRPRGVLPREGRLDPRRQEDLHHVRGQGPVPRLRARERRALRHLGRPLRARAPPPAPRAHRLSGRRLAGGASIPSYPGSACRGAASRHRAPSLEPMQPRVTAILVVRNGEERLDRTLRGPRGPDATARRLRPRRRRLERRQCRAPRRPPARRSFVSAPAVLVRRRRAHALRVARPRRVAGRVALAARRRHRPEPRALAAPARRGRGRALGRGRRAEAGRPRRPAHAALVRREHLAATATTVHARRGRARPGPVRRRRRRARRRRRRRCWCAAAPGRSSADSTPACRPPTPGSTSRSAPASPAHRVVPGPRRAGRPRRAARGLRPPPAVAASGVRARHRAAPRSCTAASPTRPAARSSSTG